MTQDKNASIIQAAGGLLWRDSPRGREIAVIHRARYGDWTLPKGKLNAGEEWAEAALREVAEETGCQAALREFAGSVSYAVDDTPKIVLFWNMVPAGPCEFEQSEEVDRVVWLPVKKAVEKLDYEGERSLIMDNSQTAQSASRPDARLSRLWPSAARKRLARAIASYTIELNQLIARAERKEVETEPWAGAAHDLLGAARRALDDGEVELGWRCFQAAQRMELFGLQLVDQPMLRARAQAILREALQKLPPWRKQAIIDLLGSENRVPEDIGVANVLQASHILHEHFDNTYHKLGAVRRQLTLLSIVAAAALITTIVWTWLGLPLAGSAARIESPEFVVIVSLFGIMGASLSGIFSLAKDPDKVRIPQQLANVWFSIARVVTGAVAALVIYSFLISGFLRIGEETTPGLILAVSFVAGFSERLLVRAVEAVSA